MFDEPIGACLVVLVGALALIGAITVVSWVFHHVRIV